MKFLLKNVIQLLLLFVFLNSCNKNEQAPVSFTALKCNWLEEPLGTGNDLTLSWNCRSRERDNRQTAYQVMLAMDRRSLAAEKDLFWNSGKVTSDNQPWMKYSGPSPDPGTQYFWKVRIWDKNDISSDWSDPASFTTGLFRESDWGGAQWIGYEKIPDSLLLVPGVHGNGDKLGNKAKERTTIPYFRKEFPVTSGIKRAFAFVSGLGQYELSVNGVRAGDRFLSPGWTDYRKTILYNTYDITDLLRIGNNTAGIIAGNGFFNVSRERYRKLVIAYGAPMAKMKILIVYNNGTTSEIITDGTWKTSPSPITFSSIYGGEDYNAQLEQPGWNNSGFDDSSWKQALVLSSPGGIMKPEYDNPVRVMEKFTPVSVTHVKKEWFIYDFAQNASGITELTVSGKKGQTLQIWPGELLDDDSLVTQRATGGPCYFQYTLKGGTEELWIPKFTYYGFRYAGVKGAVPEGYKNPSELPVIRNLRMLHTRNSSPAAGTFVCSNTLFNRIYELIKWSVKSNLASVATDCPHREKLGWLEQTHLMGNSIRYLYDISNLYNKIINDMIDAQLDNGLVPDIAPEYVPFAGGFRDSPEWGSACIILPYDMYTWYGDIDAVKRAYPMMKRYLGYLSGMADKNILSHGLGDWYDLGPRSPGEAQLTPKALTATSIYYYDTKLVAGMAEITGNNEDAAYYRKMAEEIRNSFNLKFFDEKTKVYSTGSQTAFAMPIYFGMVDENYRKETVKNLIDSIKANGKALTAGDVGYRYLLRVLEDEGYSQLISEMNSRTDVPGYGYQLSKGATSLTESWAALRYVSNNHMMLGHLMEWFYSGAGGIKQYFDAEGKCRIEISPEPLPNITWSKCSYNSVYGEIKCEQRYTGNKYTLKVTIPFGCSATVVLPGDEPSDISEGTKKLSSVASVKVSVVKNGRIYLDVPSGTYNFGTVLKKGG